MGLFDIFTGDAYKEATEQQRNYLAGQQALASGIYGGARTGGLEALRSGQYNALAALDPAYSTARADITGTYGQGADAIRAGLAGLQSGVTSAVGAYDPLAAAAGRYGGYGNDAANMYANALGLRGPAGTAAATGAFQAGPGYQFQLGQGLESLTRALNIGGGSAGGNLLREAQTYGSGLANTEFQNWLKNLQYQQGLYSPLEASALGTVGGGRANAYLTGGQGALGAGQSLGSLYTRQGETLADLGTKEALARAGVYQTGGQNIADLLSRLAGGETGFMGQVSGPFASTYGTEAAATTGGAANLWNLLGSLGKFGAGTSYGQQLFGTGAK